MKNSKAIGSPISQNDRNVNTFSERNLKGSPLSQNDRFVNPFSENFFEEFIAQKLSDVKSFLKYFSESPEAQTEEDEVKEVEQIRRNVYSILREENGREQPTRKHEHER